MPSWTYISEIDAFTIYHQVREEHSPPPDGASFLPALGHAVAGATGTAFSNVLTYPLDLVVTRLQVQQEPPHSPRNSDEKIKDTQHTSVVDAVRKIYYDEGGVRAFYSGISQDTLKSIVDSFLFFLAYNSLRTLRKPTRLTSSASTIARLVDEIGIGVLAGASAKAVTSPLQQIITFKQTSLTSPNSSGQAWSVRRIALDIYRRRGLSAFWAGYSASLILTLNPSLTMLVDSFARRIFSKRVHIGPAWTFLIAASSKAVASSVTYPFSLAKARAQVAWSTSSSREDKGNLQRPDGNVMKTIALIARHEGTPSLYSGLSTEILKGFLSHGLTMLIKHRVHTLVIWIYFKLVELLRRPNRVSKT